jgi:signal transduction histidine kinase
LLALAASIGLDPKAAPILVLPIVIVLLAFWSSGYMLHLQTVRSLHLYHCVNAAHDEVALSSTRLQEALAAEHRASLRVQREYQVRERFLRFVSHDLRQPVNALGLLLYQLKSKPDGRERDEILRLCQDCVLSADGVIEDVLNVWQVSSRSIATAKERVPLQRVFERLRAQFTESARNKGLRLVILRTSSVVVTDERLLERILRNLLSNAIRYAATGRVLLGAKLRHGQTAIVVADSGPGIPREASELVFSEGFRAPRDVQGTEGHGLGLTIARELARSIGVKLQLETQPGRGTMFRVVLENSMPAKGQPASVGQMDLSGRRILVVDDDAATSAALHSVLQAANALVESYSDPDDIRALVTVDVSDVDLAFIDYDLAPDFTAFDLLDAWPELPRSRVVVVTGHADMMIVGDVERSGVRVLRKPLSAELLLETCRMVFTKEGHMAGDATLTQGS